MVTKACEIPIIWKNSLTANFSAIDSKASSVLPWAENVKVAAATTYLPTTCNGPEGWSNVSFSAVYDKTNEQVIVEANIDDQFHFYNYGCYQVTIYYPNSKTAIGTFVVHIEPKDDICMPKQFILRDSMNTILVNTSVQLRLNGKIVFTDTTNSQGIVNLPQTLPNNCYDVEINTNHDQYKIAKFSESYLKTEGRNSLLILSIDKCKLMKLNSYSHGENSQRILIPMCLFRMDDMYTSPINRNETYLSIMTVEGAVDPKL